MASNIPPKLRETSKQQYYTKGETEKDVKINQYKIHIAEPGNAASILQRNPAHYEDRDVKPKAPFIRSGGYTPGLYAGRTDELNKEIKPQYCIGSLSEAKIMKSRQYAE